MSVTQLSDGNPDGVQLGQSASDLVAFHGATPTDQYTLATALSTITPVKASSGTVFGFSTSAKFNAAVSLLNSVRALLAEKGLGV